MMLTMMMTMRTILFSTRANSGPLLAHPGAGTSQDAVRAYPRRAVHGCRGGSPRTRYFHCPSTGPYGPAAVSAVTPDGPTVAGVSAPLSLRSGGPRTRTRCSRRRMLRPTPPAARQEKECRCR